MASSIYILSEPIQTGKTTLLMNWVQSQASVAGILTPDVDGKRKLYNIREQSYHDLQLDEGSEGTRIGRFIFDDRVFKLATEILLLATQLNPDWIVVDEIGRLELDQQRGLEPEISTVIERFKTNTTKTKLLLVVRDYLLEDAKKQYGIEDATVLTRDFFLSENNFVNQQQKTGGNLAGLALCGGQSVRMGRDKAFIRYHDKEQYAHVADMLQVFCDAVFISCTLEQKSVIDPHYPIVLDSATFANAGPMTGVLSAFNAYPSGSLLVAGCDYPFFTEADMKALVDARSGAFDVVCYHHPESGFDEPLLAIYEKQCAPLLHHYYQSGNTSLQQFLKTVNTKRIVPSSVKNITSVDC